MTQKVADRCIELLRNAPSITTLDLTGGAPELNPTFRYLVTEGRKLGKEVIDRCNLTVLFEPGQEDLADFLSSNRVRVVASLPCYGPKNVNMQRGQGVFDKSIQALLNLNKHGYGVDPELQLDLVYNPIGAFLPPDQQQLEAKYKEELREAFGIVFNKLFTITNMPIKRFADFLSRRGELQDYMSLLVRNYNPSTLEGVMCTDTVSVRWDGALFDCDFNQQLDLPMTRQLGGVGDGLTVFSVNRLDELTRNPIHTASHCFGCTAGRGSSCQGATA
jgi:radical SAM/Cys-rich protein